MNTQITILTLRRVLAVVLASARLATLTRKVPAWLVAGKPTSIAVCLLGAALAAPAQDCLEVTCAPAKTVNCNDNWSFDPPTVTDRCCSNFTVIPLGVVSTGTCPQYQTASWRVFDTCSNSNECSQTVTVVNTNQPVFQAPNITVASCTTTQVFFTPTASQGCCGNLLVTCSPPSGSLFQPGVTFVTSTTTDCCQNVYSTSFYVYVSQNYIQLNCADKYVACGDTSWTFDPPTVYDPCCPGTYTFTPQPPVTNGIGCPRTITEVWGVTDMCGNSNYCTETIYLTNAPVACFVETNGVKYLQSPDFNGGLGTLVEAGAAYVLANRFSCSNSGPITDIHLWGGWDYDQVDPGSVFTLAIWSDGSNGTPDQVLWTQTFNPGDYQSCVFTNTLTPYDYPTYGSVAFYGYGTNINYLCFYPSNSFVQTGTAAAPTNYWLSVSEQPGPGFSLPFGWMTSTDPAAQSALWSPVPPAPGSWSVTRNLAADPVSLAFKLSTATNGITNGPIQCATKVAAGYLASLFLKSDGSVWTMGDNRYGQLGNGDGTYSSTDSPGQIVTSGVTMIAEGLWDALMVKNDGSLWGWGYTYFNELGPSRPDPINSPMLIVASGVTAVAEGGYHTLFLKSDGSLWGMGDNTYGQLGLGGIAQAAQPMQIVGSGVTAISAGLHHSLFLKSDGSLWVMGYNAYGQLGDTTYNNLYQPRQIVTNGVTAISAGDYHSLFLKNDGSLWAMGYNYYGQLGVAASANVSQPTPISGISPVAIAAGAYHSLFLMNDGSLWGAGANSDGQLGDGTLNTPPLPKQVVASGVTAISAGHGYSLFIKSDHSLWGMGRNSAGQLGDGTTLNVNRPTQIAADCQTTPVTNLCSGSFQAPPDMILIGAGGTVNYPTPVATNSCCGSNITVTCTPPSGSVFPPGETTIVCQAVDCEGQTNTVTFNVDVVSQVIAPALSGNYVYNGSFESANYPGNGDISYTDPAFSLPGWALSAPASSQILLEYGQPLGFPRFADGSAAVCLRGQGTPVSISQSFQTTPGANYILRFAQSDENNSGPSCSELTVSVAGLSRRFSLTNDSGNHLWDDHGYRLQAMQFTAQSNWTTLTFTDTSAPGCPSPFLDSVCVNAGGAPLARFSTPIPSHASSFTNFPGVPTLSGGSAVFKGSGADDPDSVVCGNGILFPFPTNPSPPLTIVADTTTTIPGGIGTFVGFGSPALSSFNGGFNTAFVGSGSGGRQGIYWDSNSGGLSFGPLGKIADTTTAISNGHGNFTAFIPNGGYAGLSPSLSGSTLVFWGAGADYEGIFRCGTPATPTNPPPHSPIVDTTTVIPGGTSNFRTFVNQRVPPSPNPGPWKELGVSGSTVAFWAAGSGTQEGIYAARIDAAGLVLQPWLVVDSSTPITNGVGNFTGFLGHDIATGPSGEFHIAFVGLGAGGQQGVYADDDDDPTRLIQPGPHPPKFVADTNTLIPGGIGSFIAFTGVACGGDAGVSIAFAATGSDGQKGIYAIPASGSSGASPFPLTKIIDLNDTLDGKALVDLQLGAGGLAGNWLAFKAVFVDGTQGLYTIPVIDNLFITSVVRNGSDLQLGVTAPVGYTFGLQSAFDLTIPAWGPEPRSTFPGNGGVLNFTNGPGPLNQKYLRTYKAAYPP